VHYAGVAYLKTNDDKENLSLEDTSFIASGRERLLFPSSHSPNQNADLLVQEFDPYSIINCFDLFTAEAAARVAQAYEDGTLESMFPAQTAPEATA
jgi:hypothetical protein